LTPDEDLGAAHQRLQAQLDELRRDNDQLRRNLAAQKLESDTLRGNALRNLSEISGDGYWEQDAQHRFVEFAKNVSPDRSSNEAADDARGKCRWELSGSVPMSSSWEAHRAVLDAHQPFRGFEYRRTLSGGATSYFSVSGVPVFDGEQNFMGYRGTARDVTAIRRAEASQREAFAFLGDIVDNIPISFHLKSAESPFPVLVWNKAAQTLYGIPREEAVGRCVPDLWPDESAERLHASDQELVRLGMDQDFPDRVVRTRHRGPRHVHMRKAALKDASGTITHILVTAEDVTERRMAESRLRDSEQRFRSLTQLSSDWYWETDDCFRLTVLSGGESEEERQWVVSPMGKTRWESDSVADNAQFWAEHRAVLSRHETFRNFEYQRQDRTGRLRIVCISGEPVYDAEGLFTGYRGVGSDITARKLTETALRASEARFRAVVAALAEGVVLRDAQGRITDCNASAERILGLSRAQMTGQTSAHWEWDRLREDGTPLAAEDIPSAVARRTGQAQSDVVGYRKPGGNILWALINVQPVFEGDSKVPTGFVTTITDISKRKRDEMEIVRLNVGLEKRVLRRTAELEAANRELEAFSYSVAHDLRSPLSAIDGFSALLQKALAEGTAERANHYLGRIRAGVQRMGRLTDGLLGLVRLSRTQLHWESVDLSAEALRLLQTHAGEDAGRQVQIRVEPGMRVRADATLLRQLLENLISNAWKFSAKKSPAEITIGSQTDSDEQTVYFVRDNGAGFDMAYADKLFGTFQRLHAPEEFAGSGIGLATVNRIITRHGGRIWAQARVGEGSTFYFTIGKEQAQLEGAEDVSVGLLAGGLPAPLPGIDGLAAGLAGKAGDALNLSDHHFSNAFEHSAIGMALIAVDSRRLRINSAFCQLLGYSEAEVLMRTNHDLTHPDDIGYDMLQRKRALAGEIESYQWEKRYIHKSGRIIWVHLSCSLVRDEDRRPLMFISLVQDITERRHVEAVLRESEERFRALSELSSDWFWEQDENFRFVQVTGRTVEVSHAAPNPVLGRARWELNDVVMAPGGWDQHKAQLERHETFREFEIVRQDSEGTLHYESISGMPIFVAGRFTGYHGTGRDTTAMRQIQDALLASESQLRDITDTITARIAYVDAGQVYRFHNRTYGEGLRLAPEQINGRTMREVLGDKNYEATYPWLQEVLAGYPVVFEQQRQTSQGEMRDFVVNYLPRYGDSADEGKVLGFYLLANDVTEFKRIDRMKSEFVSTVSHELRTPLTSIRGSLGLISGGVAGVLPEAAKSLVAIASSNCERLIRLINDILDIEKIESGKMNLNVQPVELGPMLAEVLAANQHYGQAQEAALQLVVPDGGLTVQADRDRLVQVVTNLLSNAMKFSPPDVAVEVHLLRAGPRVRVEVRDRGPGIPAEFRNRIFQKFSQADASDTRQKGGTGLGLSISRAIIERFGGHIGFESEAGQGTTFFFELPEWTAPAPVAPPAPAADALDSLRPCVLVCEDDADIARLLALMLDKGGFDADLCYSAEQAQAQLALRSYAAMTVDLKLPGADGLSLILHLRSQPATRELPIVVVSASAAEGQLSLNNQSLSVSEWLEKPIDENLLILGLRRAIAGASGKPRILHVEDDLDIQRVTEVIAQDFATFEFATNLDDARVWLRQQYFDLVLLDLSLGEGSGWDLLDDIEALTLPSPVVVFSASEVERPHSPRVAAVLLKGQTSNSELLQTLQRTLARARPPLP
jgi:PAS domain S-box-containing protein